MWPLAAVRGTRYLPCQVADIEFGLHRLQAAGAQAIGVALRDKIEFLLGDIHRLALAQEDGTGFTLEVFAAAGAGFGFVFWHLLTTFH